MNEITYPLVRILLDVWCVFWVAVAAWKAARFEQRVWFIAIILFGFSTVGLLPIIYLFWFAKKRFSIREMKDWDVKLWKKTSKKD